MNTEMKAEIQTIKKHFADGFGFVPLVRPLKDIRLSPSELYRFAQAQAGFSPGFLFQRRTEATSTESYIGLDPFEILRVQEGRVFSERGGRIETLEEEPVAALTGRLEAFKAPKVESLPFFVGGAFGYLGYDFVRNIERRLRTSPGNLQDGTRGRGVDAELMFFRKLLVFDPVRNTVSVVVGILASHVAEQGIEAAYADALHEIEILIAMCRSADRPVQPEFMIDLNADLEKPVSEMEAVLGESGFAQGVKKIKEHIKSGDVFQAVLAEKFRFRLQADSLDVFEALTRLSPSPYQFHFSIGKKTYLGSSPEMLLRVQGGEMETHPIAGTRPRGLDAAADRRLASQLRRSVKEKAEHLMLVDLARNDLGRVAQPGSVQVDSFMQLKKFNSVMHLVSRVRARAKETASPMQTLAACFPAGTLSGAPKVRAMQLLSELEPEARGFYGGAVVALSFSGDLDSCIAIRCLEVRGDQAVLQAGAGIVADSKADREYKEVQHKTRALRRAIALVEALQARKARGAGTSAPLCLNGAS